MQIAREWITIITASFLSIFLTNCEQQANRASGADWPHYDGDYAATRFADLSEIVPQNVSHLSLACRILLGDDGVFQTAPLVIDATLYVTTSHATGAFDASTCAKKWVTVYAPEEPFVYGANRGAAYSDGRIFRGTGDGRLIAMDATDGHVLWKIKAVDPKIGQFLSSAPLAWSGLVFIGTAGSDWGVRGQMMAYDAATGKRKWLFYTIPEGKAVGADTWGNPRSAGTGGGGMWTSYTLDPTTDELFVPVGNPAPDWAPGIRPGVNLFTDSAVVLDARSGKLLWWYQLVPHDSHDYDLGAPPALYSDANGVAMMAAAGKDGYVHLVVRRTHTLRVKTAISMMKNNTVAPTLAGVFTCPGPLGGTEWFGPSVDTARKSIFVGSNDLCGTYTLGGVKNVVGVAFYGGQFKGGTKPSGWLTALDETTGAIKWRKRLPAPNVAGVTSTAGGVVFSGDMAGNLYAMGSDDGSELSSWKLPGAIAGGIVSYGVGGKQYVAVPSGGLSRFFGGSGSPTVTVFTLDAKNPTVVDARYHQPAQVLSGTAIFAANCAVCHGTAGAGGTAPSLKGERHHKNLAQAITWIQNPAPPMPKLYPNPLSQSQVEAVAKYVETL
ncbi:MAG: PQQ-binding-like beta-propeller repeat protein [Candidatus Eremiobacteraeota bacterium]|nr:PQQ-binding-like beta-propeller repeat protein [Candidatus Eremiobacteraeota bacterium]